MKFLDEPWIETWLRWHLYRRWTHGPMTAAFFRFRQALRTAPPGSIALDCGANVGDISLYIAGHGLHVIAFEPDPLAREELQRRTESNPAITIEPGAVGAANGTLPLYQEPSVARDNLSETIGSSLIFRGDYHRNQPVVEVPVIDLAEYIRGLPTMPWLVKLDIEGNEVGVLNAMLDAGLHNDIELIVAETHARFSPELARRTEELRERLKKDAIKNVNLDWV